MKRMLYPLAFSALLASCTHVYYAPNTPNAPLLSQKGETRINAFYAGGSDSQFEGGEFQAAHGLTRNSGLIASFLSAGRSENTGNQNETGKGSYVEIGYGWFSALDAKKRFIAEVYGGVGSGSSRHTYDLYDRSKVGISKYFLQPAFGYKSHYFEALFVPRLAHVNWKVNSASLKPDSPHTADLNVIRSERGFFAFEPAILLRGGSRNLKVQAGLSFSMSRFNANSYLYYSEGLTESLTASIGVSLNLFPAH